MTWLEANELDRFCYVIAQSESGMSFRDAAMACGITEPVLEKFLVEQIGDSRWPLDNV